MRDLIKILFRFRGYIPETSYWKTNISEFRSGWGRRVMHSDLDLDTEIDVETCQISDNVHPQRPLFTSMRDKLSGEHPQSKQHLNFDNRTAYRRWSRINTDRFAKLAPKAQISRGPGGMLPPSKFLDFNSLNSRILASSILLGWSLANRLIISLWPITSIL